MLLFVAAEPWEFAGLLPRCRNVRKFKARVSWARSAELNGTGILMVTNGAGPKHGADAVDAAREAADIHAVVSTGFCGALDPALGVASIVVADAVNAHPVSTPHSTRAYHTGALVSINHIACTAAEKRKLRGSGASAVEMEAAGVAERAQQHRLPLYCVRAVTDLADETFAFDFNRALREDGHFATMQILTSAICHPGLMPELLRLRRRGMLAAQALGEFLADCRF
jgi:adenosylhomocysteine nucleosidase